MMFAVSVIVDRFLVSPGVERAALVPNLARLVSFCGRLSSNYNCLMLLQALMLNGGGLMTRTDQTIARGEASLAAVRGSLAQRSQGHLPETLACGCASGRRTFSLNPSVIRGTLLSTRPRTAL